MERLFLDANVLFSAAYKVDARGLRLWRLDDVLLYTSRYALEEARLNLEEGTQRDRLITLSEKLKFCEGTDRQLPGGISLPQKDMPILLAAIEARVHYLLTGDFRHFGPYLGQKFEGVVIVSPSRYFNLRERDTR